MHPNVKFFNFEIKILKNKNFELKIRKKDVVIGQKVFPILRPINICPKGFVTYTKILFPLLPTLN